jgi:hypothetical protein
VTAETQRSNARRRDAVVAAIAHVPGLALAGRRVSRGTLAANAWVGAATLIAIVTAGALAGWRAAVIAWAIGHAAWSILLVRRAFTGVL